MYLKIPQQFELIFKVFTMMFTRIYTHCKSTYEINLTIELHSLSCKANLLFKI